jgi:hypothetical protein
MGNTSDDGPNESRYLAAFRRLGRRRLGAVLGCIALCCPAAACIGPPAARSELTSHPSISQTPVQAANSWFKAINAKDGSDAVAHFQSSARNQMNWGGGDTSGWPTFSSVRCRVDNKNEARAIVHCSFSESAAPDVGNLDSSWNIEMERQLGKPWLITGYGQG